MYAGYEARTRRKPGEEGIVKVPRQEQSRCGRGRKDAFFSRTYKIIFFFGPGRPGSDWSPDPKWRSGIDKTVTRSFTRRAKSVGHNT